MSADTPSMTITCGCGLTIDGCLTMLGIVGPAELCPDHQKCCTASGSDMQTTTDTRRQCPQSGCTNEASAIVCTDDGVTVLCGVCKQDFLNGSSITNPQAQ